ncbi:MAG: hypothetical protein ACI9VI_003336 [Candidatus Azotimanducaceae bacterium]|jgi:hypothetical protein
MKIVEGRHSFQKTSRDHHAPRLLGHLGVGPVILIKSVSLRTITELESVGALRSLGSILVQINMMRDDFFEPR